MAKPVTVSTDTEPDTDVEGVPDSRQAYTARPLDCPMTKGSPPRPMEAARGGPVIQQGRSMFMKTPDPFRTDAGRQDYGGDKDPHANPIGRDGKSLPPVKPRN